MTPSDVSAGTAIQASKATRRSSDGHQPWLAGGLAPVGEAADPLSLEAAPREPDAASRMTMQKLGAEVAKHTFSHCFDPERPRIFPVPSMGSPGFAGASRP
jgi:hypothetical protein